MTDDALRDRATGALVALACGDAVGTTVEFARPGTFPPLNDMVGGGPFRLEAGQWTDDTSMALCLAESIVDRAGLDPADQLRRYLLWRDQGYLSSNGCCFDIGSTTARALERFRSTGDVTDPHPDENAAANGSLMRLAPVPIRWHGDVAAATTAAGESSRTTHPARRPVDACRALGAMTAALIAGADPETVFDPGFWQFGPLHPAVEAVVRGSWRTKHPPEIRGSGYCVDALEAALWAVVGAESLSDALLRAANLGDDADTTAAIAGQLAGARFGAAAVPPAWQVRLTGWERIVSLAGALTAAAGSPAGGWAHDRYLHAWWAEPGTVLAGEYPGDPNPTCAAEKINILIDAGVRSFVDLTSPDDGLSTYDDHLHAAAGTRQLELRHHRFPIGDFGVVSDDAYDRIVDLIRAEASRGAVYVHCWGGVGRTGTVIGCLLAAGGASHDQVMSRLAELRAGTRKSQQSCPETPAQADVLARRCRV